MSEQWAAQESCISCVDWGTYTDMGYGYGYGEPTEATCWLEDGVGVVILCGTQTLELTVFW